MAKTVGDFFIERLHQWGVRRIYGYPGDGINGVFGALQRAEGKIEFIQARHEEMAASPCLSYGRPRSRPEHLASVGEISSSARTRQARLDRPQCPATRRDPKLLPVSCRAEPLSRPACHTRCERPVIPKAARSKAGSNQGLCGTIACLLGSRYDSLGYSSGIPALRRPVKRVPSYRARIFGIL
jgi:hypothetical protein